MGKKKIVYGITGMGLILLPEKRAKELINVYEALMTANTWGEFQNMVSKEMYEKYLVDSYHYKGVRGLRGDNLEELYIPAETPFTPNDVFELTSPDAHPGHPEIEMSSWVPDEVQEKYGTKMRYYAMDGNVPGGFVLELDEDRMDEIIADLEAKGYQCRRDDEEIEAAYGTTFNPADYSDPPDWEM